MNRPDRAVILAAGLGSRLRWLTHHRPKALMPVAGEAAIIHTLRHLLAFGVRHVAINLHHHGEQIARLLGDGRRFGLSIAYSRETQLLDSGGGVRRACRLLPEGDALFVHNADIIADIDLQQLWQPMLHRQAKAVLALVENPDHHPQGDFTLEHTRVGLRRKGHRAWTYAGVSLWSQQILEQECWGGVFSLVKPMQALIADGALHGMLHHGQWCDIGRPKELLTVVGRGAVHRG